MKTLSILIWCALFLFCTGQDFDLEPIEYEVQDSWESVEIIAENFYGYKFFKKMIFESNWVELRDFTARGSLLPVGMKVKLPAPVTCSNYLPVTWVSSRIYLRILISPVKVSNFFT